MVRRYNKLRNTSSIMCDQYIYSIEQKIKKQNGRAERSHRTHQLILIGSTWRDFLFDNCLYKYMYNVNFFDKVLKTIKNVNVAEELILDFNDDVLLPSPYNGRNKKVIHHYCQIGGTWEAYWRGICKDDHRDKRLYKIFTQIEHGNFDVNKIDDDKYIDFNFFCNENRCEKIGSFNNFFKSRCLKLDEKFFALFLQHHKSDIIDAIIQS